MNIDMALLDHHALDDGPDEALPVREGERGECGDDGGGEARHTPMEVLLLERHDLLAADRVETGLHVRPPLAEQTLAALKLAQFDQSGLVRIEQPMLLAFHLRQLLL